MELRGTDSGSPLARVEGSWEWTGSPKDDRLPSYLPIVIGLNQFSVEEPGYYEVAIEVEEVETRVLPFHVALSQASTNDAGDTAD